MRIAEVGPIWIAVFLLTFGFGCRCQTPVDANEQRNRDLAVLPSVAGGIDEQLAAELAARPAGVVTLEQVMARAQQRGVRFGAPRQIIARSVRALYCSSVESADGLILTVCEYPSAEQCERGEADVKQVQQAVPNHQTRRTGQSLLQVLSRSDTKPETVAAVLEAF